MNDLKSDRSFFANVRIVVTVPFLNGPAISGKGFLLYKRGEGAQVTIAGFNLLMQAFKALFSCVLSADELLHASDILSP